MSAQTSTADAFEQDAQILRQQAEQHRARAVRLREQADAEENEGIYKQGKAEYAAGAAAYIRSQEAEIIESDRKKAEALAREEAERPTAAGEDVQEATLPDTPATPSPNGRAGAKAKERG